MKAHQNNFGSSGEGLRARFNPEGTLFYKENKMFNFLTEDS